MRKHQQNEQQIKEETARMVAELKVLVSET